MLGGAILALLFLVAVWAIVILFAMPPWIAVLATVAVVFGAVAFLFWGRLRARSASREIERSLGQQADAQAQAVRPDQQIEIEAMRAEFQKAVRSLKSSKLARGGADALAILPWYMIIGPPGAGKSTALRASGLKFPFLSSRGGGVKGVGGTRNCEWWLTNEAVILDTAGRYATEDDDRDEWLGFLDVLLRTRPRKPINGLLVAISVAEVGAETEEGVIELAKRPRDRVDEVMAHLQMVLPTYLLFTKADLIPGFVETFGDLRKNERGQIWGFTLPPTSAGERGQAFEEHFDELLACVEERTLRRIGEERQLAARERIHGFPQQLEALRPNLTLLAEHLFAENVYQDTPALRGVYFTSGTQEGRTIDRVMTAMAEAFGIEPAAAAAEPVIEAKSYFLRDVFAKVIFPDKNVAVRNAKAERACSSSAPPSRRPARRWCSSGSSSRCARSSSIARSSPRRRRSWRASPRRCAAPRRRCRPPRSSSRCGRASTSWSAIRRAARPGRCDSACTRGTIWFPTCTGSSPAPCAGSSSIRSSART
jgi:type VI secretion system protein ImpL